ncbi:hypothetical protein C4S76_01805 [Apibacter adventoris]|nr:hypothetical protein C4S76_01805 [Apibacter adventoris]
MRKYFNLFSLLYSIFFFAQQNKLFPSHKMENNSELYTYQILSNAKKNYSVPLSSYQYYVYNKFYIDLNNKNYIDIDSISQSYPNQELVFLGERVTKFQHSKKYGNKNIIIADQVSGLKEPFYELFGEQMLYDKIPDILTDNFFSYNFKLVDSITYNNNKIFIISFGSKRNLLINGSNGLLYIDSKNYNIVKYSGTVYNQNFTRYFELNWAKFKDFWYLKSCINKIKFNNIDFSKFLDKKFKSPKLIITPWIIIESSTLNFTDTETDNRNDFKGYTYELEQNFNKDTEVKISPFRSKPLNFAEKQTYSSTTSIFDFYPIERKVRTYLALKEGKLSLGEFDLSLLNFLSYNDYEGFRFQIGGKTNYKFSQNYSLHGYTGFGSKDSSFKGNIGIDLYVNKKNDGKLSIDTYSDVNPFSTDFYRNSETILESKKNLNFIQNNIFYNYRKGEISYNQDFFEKFSTTFILNYSNQKTNYSYIYKNFSTKHWYHNFTTSFQINYSPFCEYLMTPIGKLTIKDKPIHFNFNYTKGWKGIGGDFNYNKFDFSSDISIKNQWGISHLYLNSGYISGKTVLWNLYGSFGNAKNANTILKRFSVKGYDSFETLLPGEFFADKFIAFFFIHKFKDIPLWGNENISISLLYNGLLGNIQNKNLHSLIDFKTPSNYYQELGIEFNHIIYYFGLGFYYRIGAYNYDKPDRNMFIKLTFNLF